MNNSKMAEPVVGKLHRNLKVLGIHKLPFGLLIIGNGSVVDYSGDAIVNAANEGCLTGAGVDGAITRAGGKALADARAALPIIEGQKRCLTGDAVITTGGNLNAKYCIHAVGPNYFFCTEGEGDEKLQGAYANSMLRAKEKGLKSIGFSLISSGIFRGSRPLSTVLGIGIDAIHKSAYEGLEEVCLCAFSNEEAQTLLRLAQEKYSSS